MATYYGRRYYSSRYPRRSSRRTYSSSARSKRRAIGNYRAALQQKDKSDVNLSITHRCECFVGETPDNNIANVTDAGVYALNIFDLLRRSDFYQSYANMYDQMKIERIKIKLTPIEFATNAIENANGGNIYHAYTIVTAWDRTGLDVQQTHLITESQDAGIIGTVNDVDGLYVSIKPTEIASYSSAITKNLTVNSNTSINRALYPSSIAEKAQYVNTADIQAWYASYDATNGRYLGLKDSRYVKPKTTVEYSNAHLAGTPLTAENVNGPAEVKNPSYLLSTTAIPFKPTLLIGLLNDAYTISTSEGQDIRVVPRVKFNLEADIGVSFRGLRKAPIVV